jgi:hypothetical protein
VTVKLGDLGLAKAVETTQSHVRSDGRTTPIVSPYEVIVDGVYSPASDVFMWAVSMCIVVIEVLGDVTAVNMRSQTAVKEAALGLLSPLAPDVALLLAECLETDRSKRPCCAQARDRVLAAAGVWPTLGAWLYSAVPFKFASLHDRGCTRPVNTVVDTSVVSHLRLPAHVVGHQTHAPPTTCPLP